MIFFCTNHLTESRPPRTLRQPAPALHVQPADWEALPCRCLSNKEKHSFTLYLCALLSFPWRKTKFPFMRVLPWAQGDAGEGHHAGSFSMSLSKILEGPNGESSPGKIKNALSLACSQSWTGDGRGARGALAGPHELQISPAESLPCWHQRSAMPPSALPQKRNFLSNR